MMTRGLHVSFAVIFLSILFYQTFTGYKLHRFASLHEEKVPILPLREADVPPSVSRGASVGPVHRCVCLEGPEPKAAANSTKFRWLHVPKTGTSFISTLYSFACATKGNIDLNVHPQFMVGCGECYDFALFARYPHEMYCRRDILASFSTQHAPVHWNMTRGPASEKVNLVGFFRRPKNRVVSAFDDMMHANGFTSNEHSAMKTKCANNVTCFANYPGIAGCQTRMLTGQRCALSPNKTGDVDVSMAIKTMKAMAFVGITEEWNEAVCQFHKTFGGSPRQGQFKNIHSGIQKHTVADLEDWYQGDVHDEAVYAAALKEFWTRAGSKPCYSYSERPLSHGNDASADCVPQSCAELGDKQCGEWPDGCGGVTVCGICSGSQRDWIPNTWVMQCISGKCVHTCPPWEDAGLWLKGASRSHAEWIGDLERQGAPVVTSNASSARAGPKAFSLRNLIAGNIIKMSPTNAIRMCSDACKSSDAQHQVFSKRFCKCGIYPQAYLKIAPLAQTFSRAHSLIPPVPTGKKHSTDLNSLLGAKLLPTESQPKCCPSLSEIPPQRREKGRPSFLWKKGNIYADFFATIELGCGGHNECMNHGLSQNATVVVLNPTLRLCHLGKNSGSAPPGLFNGRLRRHYLLLTPPDNSANVQKPHRNAQRQKGTGNPFKAPPPIIGGVSCGGHRAQNCSMCDPRLRRPLHCNGECMWCGGECVYRSSGACAGTNK